MGVASYRQPVQQDLSLPQVTRFKPLDKPGMDRGEKIAGLPAPALIAP
jgi:hypothetical protein